MLDLWRGALLPGPRIGPGVHQVLLDVLNVNKHASTNKQASLASPASRKLEEQEVRVVPPDRVRLSCVTGCAAQTSALVVQGMVGLLCVLGQV